MSGCVTPKNIDRNTQVDYSNDLQQMRNRMDSFLYNMRLIQKETSERLSNLKLENKTIFLSPPDSTGKQYPAAISNTTASKEEKENKSTATEIEATVQQLIAEINELKQQFNAAISDKERVIKTSWWQRFVLWSGKVAWAIAIAILIFFTNKKFKWLIKIIRLIK